MELWGLCIIYWVYLLFHHVLIQDLALGYVPQDRRDRLQGSVGFPLCHCLIGVPIVNCESSSYSAVLSLSVTLSMAQKASIPSRASLWSKTV